MITIAVVQKTQSIVQIAQKRSCTCNWGLDNAIFAGKQQHLARLGTIVQKTQTLVQIALKPRAAPHSGDDKSEVSNYHRIQLDAASAPGVQDTQLT